MNRLSITLDEKEMLELQGILLDRDESAALSFLENHIVPKMPSKGEAHCDSTRHNPFLLKPDGS